ncbi:MAG: tetratricopeptide repeat protein [Bryobacterales bacterium]|nr:tetratricopeptide repeat protein [Bryobacterales bacterium]
MSSSASNCYFSRTGLLACLLGLPAAFLLAAESPQLLFERAAAALAASDYPEAEKGFQAVLQAVPGHVGALGNLGVVYSRTHRYARAVEIYQRALKSAPRDPGLLLNLGLAYVNQQQYARALPIFQKLPPTDQSRELLATCQIYTGNPEAAVKVLEALPRGAGTLYLLGLAYSRLKQPEKAKAALDEMLTAASPAQANFLTGKAEYEEGRFEAAADAFLKALAADRGFPGAHLELGKTYLSLRRNADAERELKLAIAQDASSGDAQYFLGGLLTLDGRYGDAAPHLEAARALNPDSWGAYFYLGRIRIGERKPAAAIPLLERAAKLNPSEPAVFYQLAQALKQAGRDDESRKALEKVRTLKSGKLSDEIEQLTGKTR